MEKRLLVRYVLRELLGLVVMAAALFWSAGQVVWWPAWAALLVMLGWSIATAYIIVRFNPELLVDRLGPRKEAKHWDLAIMSMLGLIQLIRYVVAGLDQRFGWTDDLPLFVQIVALVVCVLAYSLVVWATFANRFFSQIVRIQSERGHVVATGGPYHYVRHPAYLGAVLYELAVPILLASWWTLVISCLNVILLLLRTTLEDRTLQAELAGYREYTRVVPYRLLPGLW